MKTTDWPAIALALTWFAAITLACITGLFYQAAVIILTFIVLSGFIGLFKRLQSH